MATEVGRIIARYIADTTSFDVGNARVKAGMASTAATARASGGAWRQYGKYGVLAVGAAVVGSLVSFAKFDRNMNIFQANTDANVKLMKAARDEAVRLGADARFPAVTAAHVADTLVELSKAGLTAQQSIATLEPVMLLGTAGQLDFAEAGGIAANAMNAFNLEAKDVPRLVDYIAGAALKSSDSVQGIAESFRYASAAAGGLGVPIQEVTTLTALLANMGVKGDMAGTSMRMFFTSLAKPRSNKAANLMQDMGLMNKGKSAFFDEAGEIKSMDKIIGLWKAATVGMTRQEVIGAEHTIFGTRGMNVGRVMDRGLAKYNAMHKASTKRGSANKLAEANTKGLYGAYQNLINSVQTLGLVFGEKLAPAATLVLNVLAKLGKLIIEHDTIITTLAIVIGAATGAWILWRTWIIAHTVTMWLAGEAMAMYVGITAGLTKVVKVARAAMLLFNTAILMNPIGIVVLAIIALILILRHFGVGMKDVKRVCVAVWHGIKSVFTKIGNFIGNALFGVVSWVRKNWGPKLIPLLTKKLFDALKKIVTKMWELKDKVLEALIELGKKMWEVLKKYAKKAANAVWDQMKKIPGHITSLVGATYEAAKSLGMKIVHGIIDGIKAAPGAIRDAVMSQIPGGSGGPLAFLADTALNAFGQAVQIAVPGAGPASWTVGNAPPAAALGLELGFNGRQKPGPSVNIEHMSVRSEEDPYVIASVLGRRMQFAQ